MGGGAHHEGGRAAPHNTGAPSTLCGARPLRAAKSGRQRASGVASAHTPLLSLHLLLLEALVGVVGDGVYKNIHTRERQCVKTDLRQEACGP